MATWRGQFTCRDESKNLQRSTVTMFNFSEGRFLWLLVRCVTIRHGGEQTYISAKRQGLLITTSFALFFKYGWGIIWTSICACGSHLKSVLCFQRSLWRILSFQAESWQSRRSRSSTTTRPLFTRSKSARSAPMRLEKKKLRQKWNAQNNWRHECLFRCFCFLA